MFGIVLMQMIEGERRAGAIAQQSFPPGEVSALDAHRGVEREAAGVRLAAHLVTIVLIEQAAADAGAQHPLPHLGLHFWNSGRSQPGGFVKYHPRRRVRSGGRPSHLAAIDASLFRYAQICDAVADIPGDQDGLIREARTGRLWPGDGALPLADLVAALPAAIPLAVEAPVRASAGLPVMERARLAYRALTKLLGRAV